MKKGKKRAKKLIANKVVKLEHTPPSRLIRWVFMAVAKTAGVSVNKVALDSYLEELGIDSLGMLQLLMHIDEQTAITLNDREVEGLKTVRDVVYLLNAKGLAV